jgi:hypothetical protein
MVNNKTIEINDNFLQEAMTKSATKKANWSEDFSIYLGFELINTNMICDIFSVIIMQFK